jgi:1-pyrroline-4-hydroxy-2-carboxylate deaminase
MFTRREFGRLALTALAAGGRSAGASPSDPQKRMRGVFIILTTPFTAAGEVDWDDLARETAFVDRCGCHGVVWPQGSSGVANLTKAERLRGMDRLAEATKGKNVALVLGVQDKDTAGMLEYARKAEALEPDAMIAMPPSAARGVEDYREYFRALARETRRPVFIQTSGGVRDLAPPVDLILDLAREFPHLGYVKEESAPLVERMKREVEQRPPLKAVFSASLGAGWLYEMRLGLDGVMTGMGMYPDLMARMWALHEKGDADGVRDTYAKFLLMRNCQQQIPGTDLYLMKKRGIFKTTAARTGGAAAWKVARTELAPDAIAEIEYRYAALKPYLRPDP